MKIEIVDLQLLPIIANKEYLTTSQTNNIRFVSRVLNISFKTSTNDLNQLYKDANWQ